MLLTADARRAFIKLRQVFIEVSILNYFDSERYTQIKINALNYIIGRVFCQLTLDNSGQWYPIAFFFRKMIFTKTWYETHDEELLAIVEVFKT